MTTQHSQTLSQIVNFGFLLALIALFPVNLSAQTVVSRTRLGGYAEDIAYVSSGTLKDQVVMTDGYDLYAVSLAKKGVLTRICKIENPEIDDFARGFTFVESEGLFVMNNDPHPNKLYFFDQTCAVRGTRTIQYLNSSYRPEHLEGMAYIPASSPLFPDHLIMVAWDDLNNLVFRLIIIRRDGVQVAEISRPDWPTQFTAGVGDVTFLAPNRLLVSIFHNQSLWTMDFNGTILSGPVLTDGIGMGEGVVQINDGRVVASSYPQNLLLFDKNLNRQPQNDRSDMIGLNLNFPSGVAWDSDMNRLLVIHDTIFSPGPLGIAGVATTLASATPVIDLTAFPFTRQTVYLPQEDIVAILRFAPPTQCAILLFNLDGTLNNEISLSAASLGENFGIPVGLTYLPGSDEFVVSFNGIQANAAIERQKLRVFSRAGSLVRTLDLSATGTGGIAGIEYFEDPKGGGGRLLILSSTGRVFITDLSGSSRKADGALFGEFNSRVKLGLITRNDLAAITSGPLAGAFATVDRDGGEIVIFRLD